jgi:hypothetical protein
LLLLAGFWHVACTPVGLAIDEQLVISPLNPLSRPDGASGCRHERALVGQLLPSEEDVDAEGLASQAVCLGTQHRVALPAAGQHHLICCTPVARPLPAAILAQLLHPQHLGLEPELLA